MKTTGPSEIRYMYPAHQASSSLLLMLYQALVRDNFQCVVTGMVEYSSMLNNAYLKREMLRLDNASTPMATTHILSNLRIRGSWPDAAPTVAGEVRTSSVPPFLPLTLPRRIALRAF